MIDDNHVLPYWKRHEPLIKVGVDAFWPDEGDRFSIYERMTRVQEFTMYEDDGISQSYLKNKGTWTKLSWDDGAKKLTIAAAPPAGVTNESTAARTFRVELLPAGTVRTVTYNGRQSEVRY